MAQYCRYCAYMICGDVNYCEARLTAYSNKHIKSTNRCKEFEFNPIDALGENSDGYKPRGKKQTGWPAAEQMVMLLDAGQTRRI